MLKQALALFRGLAPMNKLIKALTAKSVQLRLAQMLN